MSNIGTADRERVGLTIAAGVALGLIGLAVAKGANRQVLLARAGIGEDELHDPDNRIPFLRYMALMRGGQVLACDPALGLHFGEATDLTQLSIVGLIGMSCETVAEAFVQLNRYARLIVEVDVGVSDRYRLEPGDGGIWLVDTRPNPNAFPELTESAFARMAVSMNAFGDSSALKAARFTHPAPAYISEYERIFRVPLTFKAETNALLVDPSIMSHRVAPSPRYVFGILSGHADALLKSLEASKTVRGRVESLLMPVLHTGEIGIDAIAAKMGFSRWTLSRRLREEGVTFEQVLDQLRRRLALDYLKAGKASVNQIAYLVGFSEPAAFSRAFKRWTGKSPRAMRNGQG